MRILLASILLLSGCAAMSPEECEFADWQALGELDARQGRAYDYLAQRGKACNEAGFAVDSAAYREGWDAGITHFCQPDRGFAEGLNGHAYARTCPTEYEPGFLEGYNIGVEIYRARVARDALDAKIRMLEAELAEPIDLTDALIRDHERELDRARDEVRRVERELGALEGRALALGYRP